MTSSITLSYLTVRVDVVLANKKFRMNVIYYIIFSRSFRFNLEISVSLMPKHTNDESSLVFKFTQ